MLVSRLTTKYQTTIPKRVREVLALGAGDQVEFFIEEGGAVRLSKVMLPEAELDAIAASLSPEWDSPSDDAAFAGL